MIKGAHLCGCLRESWAQSSALGLGAWSYGCSGAESLELELDDPWSNMIEVLVSSLTLLSSGSLAESGRSVVNDLTMFLVLRRMVGWVEVQAHPNRWTLSYFFLCLYNMFSLSNSRCTFVLIDTFNGILVPRKLSGCHGELIVLLLDSCLKLSVMHLLSSDSKMYKHTHTHTHKSSTNVYIEGPLN